MANNAGSQNVIGNGIIPTMLIDDLNLPGCDLIQLDLEGYEFYALQGGIETIKKYNPVIVIETVWSERYGITLHQVENWLKNLGYLGVVTFDANKVYIHQGKNSKTLSHSMFN